MLNANFNELTQHKPVKMFLKSFYLAWKKMILFNTVNVIDDLFLLKIFRNE